MSKRQIRKFSDELKANAAQLITEQACSIAEAARNLGLAASQLGRWKKEIENPGDGNSRSGNMAALHAVSFGAPLKQNASLMRSV